MAAILALVSIRSGAVAQQPADFAAEPTPIPVTPAQPAPQTTAQPAERTLYIREIRVKGAHLLPRPAVEETVYPFMGAGRTAADVEQARAALEKVYQDKGYQTVSVQVPEQTGARGIVYLQVNEQPVGRLRVRGSRYFLPSRIKASAPSLAEGTVPNFNEVTRDLINLNQLPDRRVTPALHAGVEPGTVDVDLTVKDTFPLHGSLELNNRYSPDTDPLRLNGSVSYNNLWQLGHSIGFSFQLSPQDLDQVRVFSGYYIARIPDVSWLTLSANYVNQRSNVSTLGGVAVAGNGEVAGLRAMITLPPATDFYHSFTFGFDYKHFTQGINAAGQTTNTPVTYYPLSAAYSATWNSKGSITDFDATVVAHLRGLGSDEQEFDLNRFGARGSFIYLRSSLAHTHDVIGGLQVFGKVQGQLSDVPLVNSEQFAGGGLSTVRGYLEAEALGDEGVFGSVELRSPQLISWTKTEGNDWRAYLFADGGVLTIHDPLPAQKENFTLASVGIGSRIRLLNHFNGSIDVALPLADLVKTDAFDPLVTFRLWADF